MCACQLKSLAVGPTIRHAILLRTIHDVFDTHKASIHQGFSRQQVRCCQRRMNGLDPRFVCSTRWCGGDLRDQAWLVRITRFGQEDLVPDPGACSLIGPAGFRVIGTADGLRWHRQIVLLAPTQRFREAGIRLLPDLPEGLNGRHVEQPLIGVVLLDPGQHLLPILSNRFRQHGALVIGLWQAIVLGAMIIAQHPVSGHLDPDPVGRDDRERGEGMAHGLDEEFQPIQVPNRTQHISRVGPLPPSRFKQAWCARVDPSWQDWFEGLVIGHEEAGTSRLSGSLKDQAALHGILAKIHGLGMTLLALETSEVSPPEESEELAEKRKKGIR